MKNQRPNDKPSERVEDAKLSECAQSPFREICTSYENMRPDGDTITPAQAQTEREERERVRQEFAHLLKPTD